MSNRTGGTRWWRRLSALAELAGDRRQKDIAKTLGVSNAAVSGWAKGTPPSPDSVVAAARAYGVEIASLLKIAYSDEPDEDGDHGSRRTRLVRKRDTPGL